MFENRDLKKDLLALGLLAFVAFLAASLVSYDPGDPPSKLVFPEHVQVTNVCGLQPALVSRVLFEGLGLGAYYFWALLAAVNMLLLARKPIDQPVTRFIGWLISLAGMDTLVQMAAPQLSPGPVIGAGGYLGAMGRGLLELNFATVGGYIFTVSIILGGVLLATDYLLIQLFAIFVGKPAKGLGQGMLNAGAAYAKKLGGRRSDLETISTDALGEDATKNGAPAMRVKIRAAAAGAEAIESGKAANAKAVAAAEAPNTAVEEEKTSTLGSLLRIRKPKAPKTEEVLNELAEPPASAADYVLPSIELLLPSESIDYDAQDKEVRRRAKILEKTFKDFGFNIRVVEIQTGPVIAQFEVELEAGLRLSKITSLADDLAIALRVPSVRIVAPIPGKNTVGIEIPNTERQIVRLREVIEEANGKAQKMRIPVYLGKDVAGAPMVVDLSTLPHLLIAGRTGTGKSVCLNSIITSMIMTKRPDEVRMLMIDPKMVELSPYKNLPHLMHPVVTDMKKAEAILAWAVDKMEERYHLLSRTGVRHISGYNQLSEDELMERIQPENDEERKQIPTHMPYIVIIADELADLMMTSAKEVEQHIIRLAQKSRAVGIHLVLATQKPTVDVITGLIKSNLPARIAFQVASRTDSRVVLDEMGADKLLGNGDMLFLWPGTSTLLRGQGTYLSDDEINRVIASVATSEPQFVKELVQLKPAQAEGQEGKKWSDRDELYEAAIDVVVREGRGSVSLLQRALGIGYGRAARLVDFMAEDGIVGQYAGSQAREVIISPEQWTEMSGQGRAAAAAAAGGDNLPPKRTNKIQIAAPRSMEESIEERGDRDMMDDGDDTEFHDDHRSLAQKQLPHENRDPIDRDPHVDDEFDDDHVERGRDEHHEAAVTVKHSKLDDDDGPHDDHFDDDTDDGGVSDSSGTSHRHTARRLA